MKYDDRFKYLVGGYFGIREMDNYDLKVYILKDIENYIRDFIEVNPIDDFDYLSEAEFIQDKVPNKNKLQEDHYERKRKSVGTFSKSGNARKVTGEH